MMVGVTLNVKENSIRNSFAVIPARKPIRSFVRRLSVTIDLGFAVFVKKAATTKTIMLKLDVSLNCLNNQ